MIPQKTTKRELVNVEVSSFKGKYSYKKFYTNLQARHAQVYYAGPIEPMEAVFAKILSIMRNILAPKNSRLSNESRLSLRKLETQMRDPRENFTNQGITHLIIYQYV